VESQTDPQSTPEPAAAADTPARTGFLADTVEELRKVVWPSRQQLFAESVAVSRRRSLLQLGKQSGLPLIPVPLPHFSFPTP
jgi:hypothetical protein